MGRGAGKAYWSAQLSGAATLKQKLGCWLHERWRAELILRFPRLAQRLGWSWLDQCNRHERLSVDPVSGGRVCHWDDSSRLTLARIFPRCAERLLRHLLERFPVGFKSGQGMPRAGVPDVSILIPIGGRQRLPQFRLALAAARAQEGVACEVIVVEQSPISELSETFPDGVRYLHQVSEPGAEFNKSRALNAGALAARGEVLIILDADYLLPRRFASQCVHVLQSVEALRPARWIFYLDETSSQQLSTTHDCSSINGVEAIVSNNPTPLAVRRSTYWEIGGHDEDYVGWGGEDTEFLDRLRTRCVAEGGWMPVLHAWHESAPKKADGSRNRENHEAKMAVPAASRILGLRNAASEPSTTGSTAVSTMLSSEPGRRPA